MKNKKKIINDCTAIASAIAGIPTQMVNGKSRKHEVVLVRMVVGSFLLNELEFNYTELERLTNKDRCSYYYYQGRHRDNYKYWDKYKSLYDNLKLSYYGNKDNTITANEIKEQLILNNIGDNSFNSDFKITLIIGETTQNIFCKDLSKTIDKINNIFREYDFTFKIAHVNSLRYE